MKSAVLPAAGRQAVCEAEDGFCAPCGSSVAGPSVAITFSYEFFEIVELHSEFEVREGLRVGFGGLAQFRPGDLQSHLQQAYSILLCCRSQELRRLLMTCSPTYSKPILFYFAVSQARIAAPADASIDCRLSADTPMVPVLLAEVQARPDRSFLRTCTSAASA